MHLQAQEKGGIEGGAIPKKPILYPTVAGGMQILLQEK